MAGQALLIGVSEYDSEAIRDLEFVDNDLIGLGDALTGLGYQVSALGGPGQRSPTHNAIIHGVHEFCRRSNQAGNVALLYFSGHGLHYQGRDYMVPADATLEDEILEQMMVPIDFGAAFEQSRAEAVLFFIDACREGIDLGEKGALSYREWTHGKMEAVANQHTAYVYACSAGEVSRFAGGNEGFSLFTRALSDTLSEGRAASALTFDRVCDQTQKRLNELADEYEKKRQVLHVSSEGTAGANGLGGVQLAVGGLRRTPDRPDRPEVDLDAISEQKISSEDLTLFSSDLDGEAPWIAGPVSVIHVLRSSIVLDKSIDWTVSRLREFEPVGIVVPAIDLPAADEIELDRDDLVLLPSRQGARSTAGLAEIPAVHILYAANRLEIAADEVLARLRRFEPIGVTLPDIDHDQIKGLMVDRTDLELLSRRLSGRAPWLQGDVPADHIWRASNNLDLPVAEILEALRRFKACGVSVPENLKAADSTLIVSDDDLKLLSEDLDGIYPWIEGPVPLAHILKAANRFGGDIAAILHRLAPYATLGAELPKLPPEAGEGLRVPDSDFFILSEDFDGEPPWVESVSGALLLAGSHRSGESIGAIHDRLRQYEPLGLRIPLVDRDRITNTIVGDDDWLLLVGGQSANAMPPSSDSLPIAHVLNAAYVLKEPLGAVVERAEYFEAVGIEVPIIPPEAAGLEIGREEIMVASRDFDGVAPWLDPKGIHWFHLVRAAYRLEMNLGDLMSKIENLTGVGYTLPSADLVDLDMSIENSDLIVLSRDLDGIEPWIGEGEVSLVHLLRASARLEQPVESILAALERFAPIGIRLPSVSGDGLDLQVTDKDLVLLSQGLNARAPWIGQRVGVGHLLAVANLDNGTLGAAIDQLARFENYGYVLPEIEDRQRKVRVEEEDLVLVSENLDAGPPWVDGEVPVVHVLNAANRLGETVGETMRRLRRLEHTGAIGLSAYFHDVPDSRPALRRLRTLD
jgi:hypothetical protein